MCQSLQVQSVDERRSVPGRRALLGRNVTYESIAYLRRMLILTKSFISPWTISNITNERFRLYRRISSGNISSLIWTTCFAIDRFSKSKCIGAELITSLCISTAAIFFLLTLSWPQFPCQRWLNLFCVSQML